MDLMFLDGEAILMSVTDPLNLVLQWRLEDKSWQEIGLSLQGHLATLHSRYQRLVYTVPHSSFNVMMQDDIQVLDKELMFAFGDYMEAYYGTDKTSRALSVPCFALHLVRNSTWSGNLWKIDTRRR
jgi:hypothetical protein